MTSSKRWPALLVGLAVAAMAEGATNRLADETSPYLQLHAHNPVDWYPWGAEALERARREGKPIFLSVGYSTCYWCHVMEREVFSNQQIANLMNEWFINIKVDREERPELDEIYMTATQLLTGRGGWPNSVFLTPELEPFFAGTYFPPEDRRGLPGFPRVIESIHRAWQERRPEIEAQAARITQALAQALARPTEATPSAIPALPAATTTADTVARALASNYDAVWGGFGQGQKFPSPGDLFFLWQRAQAGDTAARAMVLETLRHMGRGAIYDHLDGGFHRYTLDRSWRIPHFEKMLYDNAHLGEILAIVASETGDQELERLARGTLDFVLTWMTLPNGAFKSAIDAETDAVEGAYYIWTSDELRRVLGKEGFDLLAPIFGFDREPNLENGHSTMFLTAPLEEHAARLGIGRETLLARLEPHLARLRQARRQRQLPLVDDKVLVDWNGMMIAAMARAGKLLDEARYVEAAERAASFVLGLRGQSGELQHVWRDGSAKIPAFLDDYAFLLRGLLALEAATGEAKWLDQAERIAAELESRLAAPPGGYFTAEASSDLLVQVVTANDGAIPSGNGIAAQALLSLAERTGNQTYWQRADAALSRFAPDLVEIPMAMPTVAAALVRRSALARRFSSGETPLVTAAGRALRAAGGWRPFELRLTIADGWHLNANPASLEFLIPTTVAGKVRSIAYPASETIPLAFAGEALSVYTGSVTVSGEVMENESAVRLTYQACDDRRCLPPVSEDVVLAPQEQ